MDANSNMSVNVNEFTPEVWQQPPVLQLLGKVIQHATGRDEETVMAALTGSEPSQWLTPSRAIEAIEAVEHAPREMFEDSKALNNVLMSVIFHVGEHCVSQFIRTSQGPDILLCKSLAKMTYRWRGEVDWADFDDAITLLDKGIVLWQWADPIWMNLGRQVLSNYVGEIAKAKLDGKTLNMSDDDLIEEFMQAIPVISGHHVPNEIRFVIEKLDGILESNGLLNH
ncbi:hypothetical protein F4805DRAFT_475607 [Annulohypoxylon moriforme]|nr:hypothetical protein F4805DRAFT_475607 [Annulohypoxylon moriforme]